MHLDADGNELFEGAPVVYTSGSDQGIVESLSYAIRRLNCGCCDEYDLDLSVAWVRTSDGTLDDVRSKQLRLVSAPLRLVP